MEIDLKGFRSGGWNIMNQTKLAPTDVLCQDSRFNILI